MIGLYGNLYGKDLSELDGMEKAVSFDGCYHLDSDPELTVELAVKAVKREVMLCTLCGFHGNCVLDSKKRVNKD